MEAKRDKGAVRGSLALLSPTNTTENRYHLEAYRYFPGNLSTLEWMGAYYIESQFPEKAIQYFKKASAVQPTEVRAVDGMTGCYPLAGAEKRGWR